MNKTDQVIDPVVTAILTETPPPLPFPSLSARERQVAVLLATGFVNREIADNLGISIKTVDTHRGHVLKKLNLRNNVELAREALRIGLVTLDVD